MAQWKKKCYKKLTSAENFEKKMRNGVYHVSHSTGLSYPTTLLSKVEILRNTLSKCIFLQMRPSCKLDSCAEGSETWLGCAREREIARGEVGEQRIKTYLSHSSIAALAYRLYLSSSGLADIRAHTHTHTRTQRATRSRLSPRIESRDSPPEHNSRLVARSVRNKKLKPVSHGRR
jgi:hypothetical protein